MLSQFTRQHKSHSSLNFPGSNSRLLVVPCKLRRFLSKLLEDVVDKAVHNAHRLARDSDIGMNLLENLKDVDLVGFNALLVSLLLLV
ncbi:hypothetical protein KSS87_011886, partial [Heliosperma pusillum]